MNKMPRILIALLVVLLLTAAGSALAEELDNGYWGTNLTWSLSDDYTLTISGEGDMQYGFYVGSYGSQIEKIVVGQGVTSIADFAFSDFSSLSAVEIPEGVESIGNYAFQACSSLGAVNIPSSVKSIGNGAFYQCAALSGVTGAEGVETIGENAFWRCSALASYPWSNCLKSIGAGAFDSCNFSSVTLPNAVETIGNAAFWGNANLTSATLPTNEKFTAIPDSMFQMCNTLEAVVVPSSVTSIGTNAFYGCEAATITLPDGITEIGYAALADVHKTICNPSSTTVSKLPLGTEFYAPVAPDLKLCYSGDGEISVNEYTGAGGAVTIPAGVKTIEIRAFMGCDKITSVTIPDSVTTIRANAFNGCTGMTSVTIPESVTQIFLNAFYNCSGLESVNIPSGVTKIDMSTFYGCTSLESVSIPSGVTEIGESAFEGCASLTGVTLPSGIQEIYASTFKGCTSLTSITIPSAVTEIGESAFEGCTGLREVTVPDSVKMIFNCAFKDCSSATITLPDYAYLYTEAVANVKAVICAPNTTTARQLYPTPYISKTDPAFTLTESDRTVKVVSYSGPTDRVVVPDYVTDWVDTTTEFVNLRLPATMNHNCTFRLGARNVTVPAGVEGTTYWNNLALYSVEKLWMPDFVEPYYLYNSFKLYSYPVIYGSADSNVRDWAMERGYEYCTLDSENPCAIFLNGDTKLELDVGEAYALNAKDFTVLPLPAEYSGAYSFALEGDAATLKGNTITGLTEGNATLKVTLDDRYHADFPLTVHPALQSFDLRSAQIARRGAEFIVQASIPQSANSVGRLTWVQDGEVVYTGTEHTRMLTAPATGEQTVICVTAPGGVSRVVTIELHDSISDPYLDPKLYEDASKKYVFEIKDPIHIYVDVDGETLVDDWGNFYYWMYNNYVWNENGVLHAGEIVGDYDFMMCSYDGVEHRFNISIRCTKHLHTEKWDEVPPTCENNGFQAVTYCTDCDSILINVAGETVALKLDTLFSPDVYNKYSSYYVILPYEHKDKTLMEAKAPSCTEPGNIEYYDCNYCNKGFEMVDGEYVELKQDSWVLPATGHVNLALTEASAPTCARPGNSEYYSCNACGAFFVKDGEAYTEVEKDSWVIPATGHVNLTLTEASAPTCTKPGNSEYYSCKDCGAFLVKDGEAYTEVEKDSWVIPVVNIHHAVNSVCSDCGRSFSLSGIATLTLPSALGKIEEEAFAGAPAQAIVVPDGCAAIGKRAFAECKSLRYVFLPKALEGKLPDDAFEGCSADMHLIYK